MAGIPKGASGGSARLKKFGPGVQPGPERKKNVDTAEFTIALETSQVGPAQNHQIPLSFKDRRLLLGASLRLLAHRCTHGMPILMDDVIRVASLADDAMRS